MPFQTEIQMTQSCATHTNAHTHMHSSKDPKNELNQEFMLINNVIGIVFEWNAKHLFPSAIQWRAFYSATVIVELIFKHTMFTSREFGYEDKCEAFCIQ